MPTDLDKFLGEGDFSSPFVVYAAGLPHVVASDGKMLLGVRQQRGAKGRKYPGDVKNEHAFTDWLSLVPPETKYPRLESLAWCEAPSTPPFTDEDPAGVVDGVQVNRKRLSALLGFIEADHVFLWNVTKEVGIPCLAVAGDDLAVRAVLAGFPGETEAKAFNLGAATAVLDDLMLMSFGT